MALDALRGYLALASGLTDLTRQKALASARELLSDENLAPLIATGQRAQVQAQALADELLEASRANRDVLVSLIRSEAERAVSAVGVATDEECVALRLSLDRLERRVAVLESTAAASQARSRSAAKSTPAAAASTRARAPKQSAKKATAGKEPARRPASSSRSKKASAKASPRKATPAS